MASLSWPLASGALGPGAGGQSLLSSPTCNHSSARPSGEVAGGSTANAYATSLPGCSALQGSSFVELGLLELAVAIAAASA